MAQVFSTLCLTANICLTAAPDVDIWAWLGPTYPRSRSWECRAQIEVLCPENSDGPTERAEALGRPPPSKFSLMGTEILPLAKRSTGVKLHSFLRPLSWKSPFHLEETSGDALLEATGVSHTIGETGSTCQTSPVPLCGAGAKAKPSYLLKAFAPATSPSAPDHSHPGLCLHRL